MESAVTEKQKRFKAYSALKRYHRDSPMTAEAKTAYDAAKRTAKHEVWLAKSEAEAKTFSNLDPQGNELYRIAKQMGRTNQDIVGENCVLNDAGELALTDADKMNAWVEHYSRLLNVEFDWPSAFLPEVSPTAGPPPPVTDEMIKLALSKMKSGKAAGPSGITAEMLKASGPEGVELLRQLCESVLNGDAIPSDWEQSYILNLYKGKGDALDRGCYRGLKLTDQVMKLLERVLDSAIRNMVDIDEL